MNKFSDFFRLINYIPIVALISLILVFVLWIVGIVPGIEKLRQVRVDIKTSEFLLLQRQERFSNLSAISEKLDGYQASLANVDSALPADPEVPSIFSYIQKTASQSGLFLGDLGSYQIGEMEERSNIKEITFGLKVSGSYPALKTLISALEESARFFEIENFSLSSEKDGFSFDLSLKTFSY